MNKWVLLMIALATTILTVSIFSIWGILNKPKMQQVVVTTSNCYKVVTTTTKNGVVIQNGSDKICFVKTKKGELQ